MPSPIGHVLAGLAVGWLTEPATARTPTSTPTADAVRHGHLFKRWPDVLTPFVLWCAFVAAIPDADLLLAVSRHRVATHSLTATALVFIVAAVVTGKVTRRLGLRLAAALAAAHGTHLLLDWMGTDPGPPSGLQLLWPFDRTYYVSGWDVFPPTDRRLQVPGAIGTNVRAAFAEIALLGPLAAGALFVRRRRRSRAPISVPDVPPPPSGGAADTAGTSDRPVLRAGQ